jgi:hypothetical protein
MGSCEIGNELPSSIKSGEFFTLSKIIASQEGLCFLEVTI